MTRAFGEGTALQPPICKAIAKFHFRTSYISPAEVSYCAGNAIPAITDQRKVLRDIQGNYGVGGRCFFACIIFVSTILPQLFVHGFSSQITHLLPSDGCGQILDYLLNERLEAASDLAILSSIAFSITFAAATQFRIPLPALLISSVTTLIGFAGTGELMRRNHEHLTRCDVFYWGSEIVPMNFTMASIVAISKIWILFQKLRPPGITGTR